MTIDVVTLFPGMFSGALEDGMLARARRAGTFGVRLHDLRRFGIGPNRQVDDAPYGGGAGMVLRPEPIADAVAWIRSRWPAERSRTVLLTPQGGRLDRDAARRLAGFDRLVVICGRYEGIDERVREEVADEELSVGDVVLTGGELPAMVLVDAVARFVPGVLGNEASAGADSFEGDLLDHPHFTRPAVWRGREVPAVLRSGDHGAVARWRRERSIEATRRKRPDLDARRTEIERKAPPGGE
ncbi:MAG TPA: tRNA (guanosine(37)-N1)-methyltransferase TrmD [Candidatus Polarisedimenticolaceae bacterium]